jgi:hypothetical protein
MNYKNSLQMLAIVFLAIGMASCSSLKITSDYDKTVDFSKYKTFEYYGWAQESDKLLNDLDKKRIESAFSDELYKRGLTYVESGGDMIVTLFIVIEQKTQTTANTSTMGGGYYGRHYGYGPGYGWGPSYSTTTVSSYDYAVGTLVCDVFDKANEQLIWEGIATKTVDENPATRDKTIPKAVEMLMKEYPVQPSE